MAPLSPSAELMVDPQSGARCAVRDTGAPEAECYFWTVTVFGYHQLAAGRTPELAEARSQAEAGVVDYTRQGAKSRRIAQTQEAERQQAQTNTGGVPTAPLVRRAQTQIQALFDRSRTAIFPPPGPDRGDSFFAKADLGRR
jgi:hypothetical protein